MKTKKQLAAAAAAAAAAADNKAATAGSSNTSNITASTSVTSTPIAIKKPVKRLQAKTKEIPSKPIDGQQSTSTVGSASGPLPKQQKQSAANPKSPVATKHDPPTPATKNVKNATAGTFAATKVKKSSPAAGGKNPSADKKKIQKELKNLGITDRAINQIDTAAVNPCNPSISEMVKTKSRATVSQQKAADFGSLGSSLVGQKSVPAATNSASIENPKPSEPIAATTPTKRKPVPKTKDTKAEEGAKNKTPVTAQQPTSSAPPSSHSQPCPAKEDVKAPAVPKNTDSKSKGKKQPESKDDNDAATTAVIVEQNPPKTGKKNPPAIPKPKAKSKKAILEEKRAAVVAKAAAEEKEAAEEAAAAKEAATAAAASKQEAEDKQRFDEDRTCSLDLVESDDKNDEEEVQSRIEDIMKSLEDDDDEEVGMGPLMIEPKIEKEEPNAKKKPPSKVAKSKSEGQKMQKAPICKVNENLDKTDKPSLLHNQPSEEPTKDSINQDTPKATTKRKNTKPRKPSVKKKPEPQCRTESPKHVKESPSDRDDFTTTLPQQTPSTSQSPSTLLNETTQCIIEPKPLEQIESPEPPKSIRSSTENDDDLPLNRLKDQSQPDKPQTFAVPQTPPSVKVIPSTSKTPQSTEPVIQTPAKSKRKYVRKTPTNAGSASKKKPSKAATASAVKDPSDKKPSEKKDVYDFDESESESDAPGKAGKPVFKRKQKQTSSAKEDEQDDESLKDKPTDEAESKPNKDENEKSDGEGQVDELEKEPSKEDKPPMKVAKKPKVLLKESDSDSDQSEEDKPLRKPTKPLPKPKVVKAPIKESISDSDADESEDDKERDPDERPATPVSKKIKQEVRDSSDEDSDGYSSEESVRTRIVKKQLTAKTRHLKLYGFWSGPKRHRVASLNAIAKVHCLYENETRAALEASLMKQGPSRAPRAKEVVKKEKAEEDDKKGEVKEEEKKKDVEGAKKVQSDLEKDKGEEKKQKDDEKKKVQKVAPVKEERKKVTKKTEPKEDKKKEAKKVEVKEEKKEEKKKEKEKKKEETESESESEESEEEVVTRTLRCVPGLRGVGKHWDPNASSMESEGDVLPDSDETYAQGKDTDPVKKRKVKRKIVKKVKPKAKAEKTEKPDKPKPPAKKIKKEIKALMSDAEKQQDEDSSSSTASSEKVPIKPKSDEPKKRKREPKEKKEVVEVLGKKRMASLNATAMLAATYEVQRILYRNTDSDSDSPAEKPKAKKVKEQKEAKDKESAKADDKKSSKAAAKDSKADEEQDPLGDTDKVAQKDKPKEKEKNKDAEKDKEKEKEKDAEVLLTVKTEPMRDKKDDTTEVKRELEEPRPVSSNVVIAQDTEVTITGVYVNSSLGANQEAYCKMQYRVQQSVTEERLVRPGEAPPKSYTPLTALSSMRPPNDQALSTPPLFDQPAQCDSPLGLVGPPRGFYPPSTSSSGSSSAFCAPIPHDSPGYYQPAGPLISPHLLAQAPPSSSSQHSASSSTITKQPPESDSPVQSLPQPPSSSTADSTDSDVLLTAGDLSSRSQSYGRYGPSGPPNLYPRPVQMHCPPPHLAPNYYAAPPYSQYPPEMYYAHAYPPAHFYPKFAQYYPTSRRYYPGHPGPGEHLYEQPPPTTSGPVPPPSGAQLIPAGPQGPQHLEHYPGPPPYPYPGYGSPGPGPGGQCYSRNLQPPPYMDAHYTTNCPCPMQSCPKNVNAGSLIGIKASKGPVASTTTQNSHHIASAAGVHSAAPPTTVNNIHEPILISSGSSTSSSPAPLDLHSPPIVHPAEVATSISHSTPMSTNTAASNHSSVMTTTTTTTTTTSSVTPPEAHQTTPESDLHSYMYYPNHPYYHHHHRPSAPPPTHPLHRLSTHSNPLLTEVKEEPSTPTLESESKSISNIPKLLPLTTTAAAVTMIKQELPEIKQEPPAICKKEDFEENGPAMTPDLLLDEALIKKEGMVSELLLPTDRAFKEAHKLDDKSLLSDILTAEANLITSKTTGSDSCTINNSNNNSVSINNSSISNEKVQLVDSVQPEIPASTVKRRPLLVACKKATPKKSPPNSYKNLIKRTNLGDESTITVLSDDEEEEEDDDEEQTTNKKPRRKLLLSKPRKVLKRTRRIFGAEQQRHLKKINKTLFKTKRIRRVLQRPSCIPRDPQVPASVPTPLETITITEDPKEDAAVQVHTVAQHTQPEPQEERPRPMSNVDLTIDLVAKGYFSEPEIVSAEFAAKSRMIKKLKQQEGRSQSEQNRGKRDRSSEGKRPASKKPKKLETLEADFDKRKSKSKAKKSNIPSDKALSMPINSKEPKKASKTKSQSAQEPKEKKPKKETKPSSKKKSDAKASKDSGKKRATSTPLPPPPEPPAEVQEPQPVPEDPQPIATPLDVSAMGAESTVDDRETDFDDATTMLVDDDMMSVDTNTMIHRHNNNNNSAVENKNALGGVADDAVEEDGPPTAVASTSAIEVPTPEDKLTAECQVTAREPDDDDEEEDEDEEEIMLAKRFAKKGGSLKRSSRSRSKSKSRKFSTKKRHRVRMAAEVEEVIVPRKCTGAPRWSNGWTWEGQPFQGKVFLNSDDPPVLRTCYPAMRHSEGDTIRPRDCVLLRAGSKRAELPYVAKVAHLWENPEDGEMMMSLLWYYRPEHTEQGRQPVDGPDEVFASRHKDHNSVACIEDKCYVLTFSEYCRFRRQLKGFEEGIEEHPSIVPPLRRENPRVPSSVVAPDLVMYCQRVYEFRLKRLLKQPS